MSHLDLHAEIDAVVTAAIATQTPLTKAGIYKRFKDRGAGRSTINRWIDARLTDLGVRHLLLVPGAPGPIQLLERDASNIARVETVRSPDSDRFDPERLGQLLNICVLKCQALIAMSEREDGTIRNTRLMGASVDQLRRTVATVANTMQSLQDVAAQRMWMQAIVEAIKEEPIAVRDRLIAKLRTVNHLGINL